MASSRAKVNYSFASFLPVCDIGEGQVQNGAVNPHVGHVGGFGFRP
jgi:hypothetical protein